ncbi:MAG: helix-turn-helix transcriptional regulator [Acidobacteria bacterium]|nr:helix-turn-helix transcriptional regulator [Acidobacteriota bacterium]MBI3488792.1 helix-turn-helix transcriptional regulator [Acidobacteriota bacterium]
MSEKCHSLLRSPQGRLTAHVATVSCEFAPGLTLPEHEHPEDQLVFASRGVMTVRTRAGLWVVPPSRAVWIPAGIPHAVEMSGAVSMRSLYFAPGLMRGFPNSCSVVTVGPLLRELIVHVCAIGRLNRRRPVQARLLAVLLDQLGLTPTLPLQLPHPIDPRAQRIAQLLLDNPSDSRTLDQLCATSGASRRTIQRLFLAETRMAFQRWRQQLRLLHALQQLAAGEKVTATALEAGYSSPSAFVSMFRRQLGTTPARYLASGGSGALQG